ERLLDATQCAVEVSCGGDRALAGCGAGDDHHGDLTAPWERLAIVLVHGHDHCAVVVREPARGQHRGEVGLEPCVALRDGAVVHVVIQVGGDPHELWRTGGVEVGDQSCGPGVRHHVVRAIAAVGDIVEVHE